MLMGSSVCPSKWRCSLHVSAYQFYFVFSYFFLYIFLWYLCRQLICKVLCVRGFVKSYTVIPQTFLVWIANLATISANAYFRYSHLTDSKTHFEVNHGSSLMTPEMFNEVQHLYLAAARLAQAGNIDADIQVCFSIQVRFLTGGAFYETRHLHLPPPVWFKADLDVVNVTSVRDVPASCRRKLITNASHKDWNREANKKGSQ